GGAERDDDLASPGGVLQPARSLAEHRVRRQRRGELADLCALHRSVPLRHLPGLPNTENPSEKNFWGAMVGKKRG
ncbi:unnamed protein product, partial [Heterosigma akashiwo]